MKNYKFLNEDKVINAILCYYPAYKGEKMWVEVVTYNILDENFAEFYLCGKYLTDQAEVNTRIELTEQDLINAFSHFFQTDDIDSFTPSFVDVGTNQPLLLGMGINFKNKEMKRKLTI